MWRTSSPVFGLCMLVKKASKIQHKKLTYKRTLLEPLTHSLFPPNTSGRTTISYIPSTQPHHTSHTLLPHQQPHSTNHTSQSHFPLHPPPKKKTRTNHVSSPTSRLPSMQQQHHLHPNPPSPFLQQASRHPNFQSFTHSPTHSLPPRARARTPRTTKTTSNQAINQ